MHFEFHYIAKKKRIERRSTISQWAFLGLKIKIQSDKKSVEFDLLSLRRMILGLLNVLILEKSGLLILLIFGK